MPHRIRWPRIRLGEKLHKVQRPEHLKQQKHPQHESKIADAIDDERFFPRVRSRFLQEIKSDEQIARKPHALPANEQQHVICGQYQDKHEEHEQVEVGKEAVVTAFMRHVSGRVNVNQPADSGHDQDHHDRQLVHLQVEACVEISRGDPGEEFLVEKNLPGFEKFAHRFERA